MPNFKTRRAGESPPWCSPGSATPQIGQMLEESAYRTQAHGDHHAWDSPRPAVLSDASDKNPRNGHSITIGNVAGASFSSNESPPIPGERCEQYQAEMPGIPQSGGSPRLAHCPPVLKIRQKRARIVEIMGIPKHGDPQLTRFQKRAPHLARLTSTGTPSRARIKKAVTRGSRACPQHRQHARALVIAALACRRRGLSRFACVLWGASRAVEVPHGAHRSRVHPAATALLIPARAQRHPPRAPARLWSGVKRRCAQTLVRA